MHLFVILNHLLSQTTGYPKAVYNKYKKYIKTNKSTRSLYPLNSKYKNPPPTLKPQGWQTPIKTPTEIAPSSWMSNKQEGQN